MIVTHKETVLKEENIIDDIYCNRCGKVIPKTKYNNYKNYITINSDFGYLSDNFFDGEKHEFETCEDCYTAWLKTFKYAPKGFGERLGYEKVDFEEWKKK